MSDSDRPASSLSSTSLAGQLLVALPGMTDPRFARAVILICAHTENSAMGLQVNAPIDELRFEELLLHLDIGGDPTEQTQQPVLAGGPVERERGFVLHSLDFQCDGSTEEICDGVALTVTREILEAIGKGQGPARAQLLLGYAGWDAGQLEEELKENVWMASPATPAIVFDHDHDSKWRRAIEGAGIDANRLSALSGHA